VAHYAVLEQVVVRRGDVSDRVRLFVGNPCVCSVALSILDHLAAQPFELTVERLLLEYWRWRIEERGDLVAYDTADFERLLPSYAREHLANPTENFDRNGWREYSAAASRGDGRWFHDDLTEIEEGRFLQLDPEQPEFYHFKWEMLPFALGLLIAREIANDLRGGDRGPVEAVEAVLDEIGGFDLIGESLGAAAGAACIDEEYPPSGRAALVAPWLRMQNLSEANLLALLAYAPTRRLLSSTLPRSWCGILRGAGAADGSRQTYSTRAMTHG